VTNYRFQPGIKGAELTVDIKKTFLDTLSKYNMIEKGDMVLAGVSGGPDSVCLLHLLWVFKDQLGVDIAVAHLDHMFRGKESEEDARFVEDLCRKWGITFYCERADVPAYIEKTGLSPEDAARRVRYAFFERARLKTGARKVALGHNRNDHEETVLMNILRGSGLEGLVGIEPVRDFYIRPLLEIPREEIELYLKEEGIPYRIDRTNLTTDYFRNRIRLELIPLIEEKYCGHFGASLRRLSDIARQDLSYLEEETGRAWEEAARQEQGKVFIDIKKFSSLHEALKRRIIRKSVECLVGDVRDFEHRHTVMLVQFIEKSPTGTVVDLPKGLKGRKIYEHFCIFRGEEERIPDYCYDLPVPGRVFIKEAGVAIEAEVRSGTGREIIKTNPLIAQLDYDKIKGNLTVRNRRPGDRFKPLGAGGFKKLQDFFTDEKVPGKERDKVPVVTDNGRIVWVAGMRIDDRFKITSATARVLLLKLERQED
jgi:tRNA(Ile)-lysidine synthase